MVQPRILEQPKIEVISGVFTKREAAMKVASGVKNIHSTALKERDPGVVATLLLLDHIPTSYAWEVCTPHMGHLRASQDRLGSIHDVVRTLGLSSRRDLKEKLESVAEELLSNALYHAYKSADGTPKYKRQDSIMLTPKEAITFRYALNNNGAYFAVTDQGGLLDFSKLANSFHRCYVKGKDQIESKDSGAGLGMYMVFELVTHLKISVIRHKETSVSCWIPDKRSVDPQRFSFNYFERDH